jgi:hypothetical protein
MALAKYLEDNIERWLEGTQTRYEDSLNDLFAQFPAALPRAGEVYLERSGRRMEDVEVCEARSELILAVVAAPGAATPVVELEEEGHWNTLQQLATGGFVILFPVPGQKHLRVSSEGYLREYTLHAIDPFRVEEQPDFSRLIRDLSDNPPFWTDESFTTFRRQLESVLATHRVPKLFSDGVVEYHMGLFHEEQRRQAFRERFQAAYGSLRWFIPYSDIARLICAHYLFCANEFAAALTLCRGGEGKFQGTLHFFLGDFRKPKEPKQGGDRHGLPLLVALPDALTFQAVHAVQDNRGDDALELCAAIRREIIPAFDRERAARLAFVEAWARTAVGEPEMARSLFENLNHSAWPSIATAARKNLPPETDG